MAKHVYGWVQINPTWYLVYLYMPCAVFLEVFDTQYRRYHTEKRGHERLDTVHCVP